MRQAVEFGRQLRPGAFVGSAAGAGVAGRFVGTVVSSTFRRGYTEVVVDVDLGDGVQSCAAVADGAGTWCVGAPVALTVAASATVFVPAAP